MKLLNLLALAASAKLASAHSTVMAAWLNDVDLGLGNSASGYIRSPPNNSPITDVASPDMSCNVNGGTAVARTIEVEAGDEFTFEWHHNDRSSADDIIDLSHKGPVLVYIAPTAAGTAGTGWVKIAEDGYDGEWAVERLVANRGQHSVTIPDIAAGEYLLRAEIIALHEGNRVGGAQLYMECVQIQVTSSGSTTLPSGVAIPGAYSAEDPGILFDLYNGFTSYTIPGPAVWDGASGGDSAPPASSAPTSPATTLSTVTTTRQSTTATSVAESATTEAPSTSTGAAQWAQCGGTGFSGPTTCSGSFVCTELNPYYSQCI